MTWDKAFKLGAQHFKSNRYEEALESFNQAIRENSKNKTLYDSRAAVFEKLNRPLDALKDSKEVIDLAPQMWQGYARSARIFHHLGRNTASLKMVDLALERLKPTDVKRRAELEALREKAAAASEPPPCHFLKLPVELQTEIFTLVVDGSNRKMLALTLICRTWREIIIHNPKFWRHLVLTPNTTLKKADAWLERANGVLSRLCFEAGFTVAKKPKVFRNASSSLWSKLDELEMTTYNKDFDSIIPIEILHQLRPRSITLTSAEPSPALVEFLRNVEASRLQKLGLTTAERYIISLEKFPFSALTTLELTGTFTYHALLALVERNPSLEVLRVILTGAGDFRTVPEIPNCIDLPNLKYLMLSDTCAPDMCLRKMQFPNLQSFQLMRATGDVVNSCIEEIRSRNLSHLKDFGVPHCHHVSAPLLISFLLSASKLESLIIKSSSFLSGDINLIVNALTEWPSDGENGASRSIPCPRLQELNLSLSSNLRAGPLARLVKAHLAIPTDTASGSEPVPNEESSPASPAVENSNQIIPIRSLIVDECELIDPSTIPWFRATVANVSNKIKPVKMGRGQR